MRLYWSQRPGSYLDSFTGEEKSFSSYSGSLVQWYFGLTTTIIQTWEELAKRGDIGIHRMEGNIFVNKRLYQVLSFSDWFKYEDFERKKAIIMPNVYLHLDENIAENLVEIEWYSSKDSGNVYPTVLVKHIL